MNPEKSIAYGLPVLSHLNKKTIHSLYRLLFLASLYTAREADQIIKSIYSKKRKNKDLSELIKNLESVIEFDKDVKKSTNERKIKIYSKVKDWILCFPDLSGKDLKEYFDFHGFDKNEIYDIISYRINYRFRTPRELKEYLDTIVIAQESAKKVLSFGFYLHLIRIGKLKPAIHISKDIEDVTLPLLPKPNILLMGPTGSGKTLIIRSLCEAFCIPFIKIDCSALISSGYVGNGLNDYLKILIKRYGEEEAGKAVIYFDEFDKLSELHYGRTSGSVGGIELQQEFLSLLEDEVRVITRTGYENGDKQQMFKTRNLMFVFSGSFAGIEPIIEKRLGGKQSKLGFKKPGQDRRDEESVFKKVNFDDLIKFGIIPELAGRVGFIGVLDKLVKEDIIEIMKNANENIFTQYNNYFLHHFDKLIIEEEVYELIADEVIKRNIGARALNSVAIELLQDLLYKAPNEFEEEFRIDAKYFKTKFG